MGGREQWASTVSYSVMPVAHEVMLACSSSTLGNFIWKPQLCLQGKDRGYQLQPVSWTQCLSQEVSEWEDVKSDILIVIPPFWPEQRNTGNWRYFCHAFTVSFVKGNTFVIICMELCSSKAKSWFKFELLGTWLLEIHSSLSTICLTSRYRENSACSI